ncbi:hypothetical protein [Streptomyces sp. NPDC013489]|uniref:hypothetical protein n=1 Tax=Streptomyces sp. NPDC013489 TaxID=3155606 RepID=UPI0034080083
MTTWINQFRIRAERQQHGSGVHRQRLTALQGAIDKQAGQGFRILVLCCKVGWCPAVAHRGIQQRSKHSYQRKFSIVGGYMR